MRMRKVWSLVPVVVGVLLLTAPSMRASSKYVRSYVAPSGDGDACNNSPSTPSCVDGTSNTITYGPTGSQVTYDLFQINVTQGSTFDFLFPSGVPSANADFQVLACGYGNDGTLPAGIYTSGPVLISGVPCTALGDPVVDPANFITDDQCAITNTLCYTFSGSGLPTTWVFTGPSGLSIKEQTSSVPEPASLSLLAAGLLGLGAFRRKRPA